MAKKFHADDGEGVKSYIRTVVELWDHVQTKAEELGLLEYFPKSMSGNLFLEIPDKLRLVRNARSLVRFVENTVDRGRGDVEENIGDSTVRVWLFPSCGLTKEESKNILRTLTGGEYSYEAPRGLTETTYSAFWLGEESKQLFGSGDTVEVKLTLQANHPDFKLEISSSNLSFDCVLQSSSSDTEIRKAFRDLVRQTPGYKFKDTHIVPPRIMKEGCRMDWEGCEEQPTDLGALLLHKKLQVPYGEGERYHKLVLEAVQDVPYSTLVSYGDYEGLRESYVYLQYHAIPFVTWDDTADFARKWISDPEGIEYVTGTHEIARGKTTGVSLIRVSRYKLGVAVLDSIFSSPGKCVLLEEFTEEKFHKSLREFRSISSKISYKNQRSM